MSFNVIIVLEKCSIMLVYCNNLSSGCKCVHGSQEIVQYKVNIMSMQMSSRVGVQYSARSMELHIPLSEEVLQDSRVVELLRLSKQAE